MMAGKYKTLTLVEEGELERLRQRQLKDYNPGLKSMVSIQDQIEIILKDPQLDDDSKYKILTALQEKFGYLYNKFKNSALPPPQLEVVNPAPPEQPELQANANAAIEHDEEKDPYFDADTITEVDDENYSKVQLPSQYKEKFKRFQTFLEENRKAISKNHKNELILDGVVFPNSSMSDLLRSFYVRNVSMNLIGLPNLLQKLYALNVNPDLFSNKDATNSLKQLKRVSSEKTQKGKGKSVPPGKRPRLLHVFR